ncbi:MAG: hypothetical protein HY658_07490 [Actinobacteria bacterium]|nr:hypothetical protein [Actinomycetota bacterium]
MTLASGGPPVPAARRGAGRGGRAGPDGERGSATIVAAAIIALLVVLAMLTVDAGRLLWAVARAQSAADAAALAAAQELALPTGSDPVEIARTYAAGNGAEMASCQCAEGTHEALVVVEVAPGPMLILPDGAVVQARARAAVALPEPNPTGTG